MSAGRIRGWTAVLGAAIAGIAVACATTDAPNEAEPTPSETIPTPDAGDGGDADNDAECTEARGCVATTDCSKVDFCPVSFPVSRLVALNAVWGSGPNDVWAVGTRGTVLHGDGKDFVVVPSGTSDVLFSVWGTAKDDVWILGATAPMHSDGFHAGSTGFVQVRGASWNAPYATSGRIWSGYSDSNGRVWIAGEPSRRFGVSSSLWYLDDGATTNDAGDARKALWASADLCSASKPCTPKLRRIWGTGSRIWAVGGAGQILHTADVRNGEAVLFSEQDSATRNDLEDVWGSSPDDVWAVGAGGTIRHGTGTASVWSAVPSPTTANLHAVWGSGPSDVWAVGNDGAVLHFDGQAWTLATIGLPPGDSPTHLFGIWGSGPDDVWIVGEGIILHRTAASRRHP